MPARDPATRRMIRIAYEAWDSEKGIYDALMFHHKNNGEGHCHIPKIKAAYEWFKDKAALENKTGYEAQCLKQESLSDARFEVHDAIVIAPANAPRMVLMKLKSILGFWDCDIESGLLRELRIIESELLSQLTPLPKGAA